MPTNMPLDETINICTDTISKKNDNFNSINICILLQKKRVLFHFCYKRKSPISFFYGNFYKYVEGKTIGPSFYPVFANVFMVNFEKKMIIKLPIKLKASLLPAL